MKTTLDYSLYLEIAGRFLQIGVFMVFVVGCYRLWRITARISLGFEIIGRIVTVILFLALLLMGFGPDRVVLFRILVYGSLSLWVFYVTWYFGKYQIPPEYLKANRVPADPTTPIYVPRMALLRYLIRESPEERRPWWHSKAFRNIGVGLVGVFLLLYGFSQTINGYSWGYSLAAGVQARAAIETKKAVKEAVAAAVDSTKKTIQDVAIPLKQGQDQIIKGQKTSDEKAVERAASVKQELKRANAKLARPSLIITAPAPKSSLPGAGFSLPNTVTPPPPIKKGKRFGYEFGDSIRFSPIWVQLSADIP